MIQARSLNISKLMDIMPPGTVDPTPYLYNNGLYAITGLMAMSCVAHSMIRPVKAHHFEENKEGSP